MSMVMMPLLIKVKMTEENFKELLLEAARMYYRSYLRKYYRYDGTYFTLDLCGIDNSGIYMEAKRIARYTDCENEVVGLIYDGGPSYSVAELVFSHGVPCFKAHTKTKYSDLQAAYLQHKEIFLNKFPASSGNQYSISEYIPASSTSRHYICEAMTQDALEGLFETNGYHVEEISTEDRHVEVFFYDCDDAAEDILAQYYGCQQVLLIPAPEDFYSPNEFLLIRITLASEEEAQSGHTDYKDYFDRISALPNCNNCGIRVGCKFAPLPGQTVRINCPLWADQENT